MSIPSIQAARNFDFCQQYERERPSGASRCFRDRGPPVYAMDVGQWFGNPEGWYIGLVSGSHMLVVRIMAGDESSIAQPTTPVLDNVLKLLKARELRPFVQYYKKIDPWKDEEKDYKDEILMSKDKLLVLFPDCHVGLRDSGDMFSKDHRLTSCNLLLKTIKVLREAAGSQVKIVQLGDFLEVWETEAKPGIYFEYTGKQRSETIYLPGSPLLMGSGGTTMEIKVDEIHLRNRSTRAELAIEEVRKNWKGTPLETSGKIFDMMLLGNHDVERRWTTKQFYDLGKIKICDRVQTGRDGCVIFEHGHDLDTYNDTRPANSIENVLSKVTGKGNTYEYGRNKPGRRWRTPNPADPDDTSNWWTSLQDWGLVDLIGEMGIEQSARKYCVQLFREAYLVNGFILKSFNFSKNYKVPVRLWIHAHTHMPSLRSYNLDIQAWHSICGELPMDNMPSLLGGANNVLKWSDLAL